MTSQSSGENGSQRSPVHLNWRDFQESALQDQKLNRIATAKALDIPYDTMGDITVTKSGLGGWAAAALLATGLAGGGGAFLAAHSLLQPQQPPQPQQAPKPDPITETKTYDYNVEMEVERR